MGKIDPYLPVATVRNPAAGLVLPIGWYGVDRFIRSFYGALLGWELFGGVVYRGGRHMQLVKKFQWKYRRCATGFARPIER